MPFSRASSATTGSFPKMFDRSRGLSMVARPSAELAIAQRVQLAPERLPGNADPELLQQPLTQIDQPPAHHAVDRWKHEQSPLRPATLGPWVGEASQWRFLLPSHAAVQIEPQSNQRTARTIFPGK